MNRSVVRFKKSFVVPPGCDRRHHSPRREAASLVVLFFAATAICSPAWAQQDAPNYMRQAETLADTRIENFRNANDPVARRTAFLELQSDPIAVTRLNAVDADGRPRFADTIAKANAESIAIREPVKARLKAEVAARYGVSEDAVQTVEYGKTPQSHPDKFGQDWDLTARINGRDVPAPEAQKIAHQAYLDSATMNGKIQINVENPNTRAMEPISPDQFAHRQSLAVTDHLHSDAYAGGKTGGRVVNQIASGDASPGVRLRDPTQLAQAIEYKSNEAGERAAHFLENNEPVKAQSWQLEQVRQSTKQFDKFVKPMVEANGGQVPATLQDGMDVLKQVTTGEITPAQAEARLQALGETRGGQPESIEGMIRKNAQLVEASQVLKDPASRGAAVDRNDFVESVRDRLANKGVDLDPDQPRNINDARFRRSEIPGPETAEARARAQQAAREKLIDDLRNNDLLDERLRNKLADDIVARDAKGSPPPDGNGPAGGETPPAAETKPGDAAAAEKRPTAPGDTPAGEMKGGEARVAEGGFDVKGKMRTGLNAAGEVLMLSDGLNLAQDLIDVQQGKKDIGEVALTIADLGTLGTLGISRGLTEKALDRADGQAAVANEQARKDETWIVNVGNRLREQGVSAEDRIAIMKALGQGDRGPLDAALEDLRQQGKAVTLPERETAELQADDTAWQRTVAVGEGMAERLARAGRFVYDTGANVIEIPWDAVDTLMKSLYADSAEFMSKERQQAMIDDLVNRGATRDEAEAAVLIFRDSNGQDREILDRILFDLSVLEAHPELRNLSPEERDRMLYRMHEQFLADKEAAAKAVTEPKPQPDAPAAADAAAGRAGRDAAAQAARELAAFADKLQIGAESVATIGVPSVVGQDLQSAQRTITAARLMPVPVLINKKPDNVKPFVVFGQEPSASTPVALGTSVQFLYSLDKPAEKTVQVPSLLRLTKDEAEKMLAGLEVKLSGKPQAGDRRPTRTNKKYEVYSQTPAAGTEVTEGTTVNFEYYAGIPVGRYIGLKKNDAIAAIEKDGLRADVKEGDANTANPAERLNVYTQTPEPGGFVWFDDPVSARYYKFSEGFQEGDGKFIDARFAGATVSDGSTMGASAGERTMLMHSDPSLMQPNGRGYMIVIKKFPDAASARAAVQQYSLPAQDPGNYTGPAGDKQSRAFVRSDVERHWDRTDNAPGFQTSFIIRALVHRDVFLINYYGNEGVYQFDHQGPQKKVFENAFELIKKRFPPE